MELIYCSKCGNKIPPGGLDEGRRFVVNGEPVCPKCYEQIPVEDHTGNTLLHQDAVPVRPKTSKFLGYGAKKPSTRVLPEDGGPHPAARSSGLLWLLLSGAAVVVVLVLAVILSGRFRTPEPEPYQPPTSGPSTEIAPPPSVDPERLARERRGQEMYELARDYWQKNPGNFAEALARFEKVAADTDVAKWRATAREQAGEVRKAREAAADKILDDIKARAERLGAAGNYDAAQALCAEVPDPAFAELLNPRLAAEREALVKEADARIGAIAAAAGQLSKDGQPEKGLAEIEKAATIKCAAWEKRLAALRERLGQEVADSAGKAQKQREARARKLAEDVLNRFENQALAVDWRQAAGLLAADKAGLDRDALAAMPTELAAAERVARELSAMAGVRKAALDKLVGQELDLLMRSGTQLHGKVLAVADAGLKMKIVRRFGVAEAVTEEVVPLSGLADGEMSRLLPAIRPNGNDGQMAAAAVCLADGNPGGADAALKLAGDHPLAARWTGRLAAIRLAAREAAAGSAWQESVAKLVRERYSDVEGQALGAVLDAFVRDHGASNFAKARETEIAALRTAASGLVGRVQRIFKGQVVRFDPATLEIELLWDFSAPEQLQDFTVVGKPLVEGGQCVLATGCRLELAAVFRPQLRIGSQWKRIDGNNFGIGVSAPGDVINFFWGESNMALWRGGAHPPTGIVPGAEVVVSPKKFEVVAGDKRLLGPMEQSWREAHLSVYAVDGTIAFDSLRATGIIQRQWLDGALRKAGLPELPPPADGRGWGLLGQYFSGANFDKLVLTREDPEVYFHWGMAAPSPEVPADPFSVRWTGQLTVPRSGRFTFLVKADDICRLWVDGQPLVKGGTSGDGKVDLVAGKRYDVQVEFADHGHVAAITLEWSGPGIDGRQIVPEEHLFPAKPAAPAPPK